MAKKVLGRGLKALIPETPRARAGYAELRIDVLQPGSEQPRARFDQNALEGLAASIREHGILQPLLVTDGGNGRFRILAGERRWRAAKKAGIERVPVVIRERVDEQAELEIALIENLQRRDLTPLEEARAYDHLRSMHGLSQAEVAERVGFQRSTIANSLRLLKLPENIQEMIEDGRVSAGHARALLSFLNDEDKSTWAEKVAKDGLSVRSLEREAAALRADRPPQVSPPPKTSKDPNICSAEKRLTHHLGSKVEIKTQKRGGKIIVSCTSRDELMRVFDLLLGSD